VSKQGPTGAGFPSLTIAILATVVLFAVSTSKSEPSTDTTPGSKQVPVRSVDENTAAPSQENHPLADQPAVAEAKKALRLRKIAEDGDAQAQYILGLCYDEGRGVTKDPAEAVIWFQRAAEQGHVDAQYALGCHYNGENGLPKVPSEAAKWWEKAATQGHAGAQYCLGLSLFTGEGVAQNHLEAVRWWEKAAQQDHAEAQYFLGLSYSIGLGVPKVEERALYWFRKAATNGSWNAIAALKKLGGG